MTTIVLTADQVASIIAQQGGTPGPTPPPVVTPPPVTPPVVLPGNVKILSKAWDNAYAYTGGFGQNDIFAVQFTTGSKPSLMGNLPKILAAQWQSEPHDRVACLCEQPGLFSDSGATLTGLDGVAHAVPGLTSVIGQTPTIPFSLGVDNLYGYPRLELNRTYYFNIKNVQPTDADRPYDMSVNLQIGAL